MKLLYTAHVPAGDGPFRTIVALHGFGANAHDLLGLAPLLEGGAALVLCPQGPLGVSLGQGMVGYSWFPLAGGAEPEPGEVDRARQALDGFLEEKLAALPVDRRKVALLGFSQGGVMAYQLALRAPERYAGLVALSSWLPPELAAAVKGTEGLAELPSLVMHGIADPMVPVDRGREARDRLIELGVPTTYREYDGMQHEIRPEALRDLLGWLDQKAFPKIV